MREDEYGAAYSHGKIYCSRDDEIILTSTSAVSENCIDDGEKSSPPKCILETETVVRMST